MNIDDPSDALFWAERRVLGIQTKLHQWATDDTGRRFNDLFNLVCDPAFLLVAWERVRSNRGARTAGVDGISAHAVRLSGREDLFLDRLRRDLKTQTFIPLPVREVMIPKGGSGKVSVGWASLLWATELCKRL
ncbi:hypothetical protein ACFVFJ_50065 [Streptomyces sp. NPDC057717]|uniref:hypothetical protein n=1 Tax=Streptomyces sp. NPDC057717 TaxID=3346224 RepID=UPI0036C6FAE6